MQLMSSARIIFASSVALHHFFDFHGGTSVTGFEIHLMQVADESIIPARSGQELLLPPS
jgi:hypothetical protein